MNIKINIDIQEVLNTNSNKALLEEYLVAAMKEYFHLQHSNAVKRGLEAMKQANKQESSNE